MNLTTSTPVLLPAESTGGVHDALDATLDCPAASCQQRIRASWIATAPREVVERSIAGQMAEHFDTTHPDILAVQAAAYRNAHLIPRVQVLANLIVVTIPKGTA